MMPKVFEIEVNSFNHGKLIKNPRILFTIYRESGEQYPMKYGDHEASFDHLDWLASQVTTNRSEKIRIEMEFYDSEKQHKKLTYVRMSGQWKLEEELA